LLLRHAAAISIAVTHTQRAARVPFSSAATLNIVFVRFIVKAGKMPLQQQAEATAARLRHA